MSRRKRTRQSEPPSLHDILAGRIENDAFFDIDDLPVDAPAIARPFVPTPLKQVISGEANLDSHRDVGAAADEALMGFDPAPENVPLPTSQRREPTVAEVLLKYVLRTTQGIDPDSSPPLGSLVEFDDGSTFYEDKDGKLVPTTTNQFVWPDPETGVEMVHERIVPKEPLDRMKALADFFLLGVTIGSPTRLPGGPALNAARRKPTAVGDGNVMRNLTRLRQAITSNPAIIKNTETVVGGLRGQFENEEADSTEPEAPPNPRRNPRRTFTPTRMELPFEE